MTAAEVRVNAAVARALIRAMGMQSENARAAFYGDLPTHNQNAFEQLIDDEHIDWNSVIAETNT